MKQVKVAVVFAICAVLHICAVADEMRLGAITVRSSLQDDFAQSELIKHLKLIGIENGIGDKLIIELGKCAPGSEAVRPFTSYGRRAGDTVYLWGDDSCEKPKSQPRPGTLFAVYGFLEDVFGVRWVSPGDEGIVFEKRESVSIPKDWSWSYVPPLKMGYIRTPVRRELRHAKTSGRNKYLPMAMRQSAEETWQMEQDFRIWALRMKLFVKERDWEFGHAFVKWNERFIDSNPEFLALQENGERGTRDRKWNTRFWMKICVSNEAVVERIVKDWATKGCPRHLNICQNDGVGLHCRCDACRALDCPLKDEAFGVHVTDRYVNFANRIAKKAMELRKDVQVCCYAYQEYRYPPRREKIAYPENIVVGMVPSYEDDGVALVEGWKKAGLERFTLRPNFLFYHGVLPRGFERDYFEGLKKYLAAGVMGCDYDCNVRGGVTDFEKYAVARLLSNEKITFEQVEADFLSQYGAAAPVMKQYYQKVRARGEAALKNVRQNGSDPEEACTDDSCRHLTVLKANPRTELESDLQLLRGAAALPRLSKLELARVNKRMLACEHMIRTLDFLLARDRLPREEFVKVAFELIDYRTQIWRRLPDNWGAVFRGFKDEVRWWRAIAPEVKAKFPEMELAD